MRRCLTLLVLAFVLSGGCAVRHVLAQNSGAFMPYISPQFVNAAGTAPLANGFLCTYASGSTTPKVTYQDNALTVDNHNPVQLNSAGRPVSWGTSSLVSVYLGAGADGFGTTSYKMVLYAAGTGNTCNGFTVGSAIKTIDNVYDFGQVAASGWTASATVIYPASGQDVLVGASTDANAAASGQLHVVGTELRVFSDSTADSNFLDIRATGGAITFEERLNGLATHIPMNFRDGGNLTMKLDGTASTAALTLGNVSNPGIFNVVSSTSSSTYTSQGVTSNSITTTNGYFGLATSPTPIDTGIPLFVKRASGSFAVFQDTAGSSGSLILVTSSTSGTFTSGTTGVTMVLHSNATASSPLMTAGVFTASAMGTGFPGFAVTDASAGIIFQADATANAASTGILVWHNGTLQRVVLGAADSCTAGFRCLRLPN